MVEDWRCDQYRWINQGVKRLPKKDPVLKKSYIAIEVHNLCYVRMSNISVMQNGQCSGKKNLILEYLSAHTR